MILGNLMRPSIWVSESHAKLAFAQEGLGHRVGDRIRNCANASAIAARPIARAWRAAIMSTGTLIQYINAQVQAFQAAGQPVISVDTRRSN